VLAAVGARLTNAQIARQLHISVRTVESHVSSLLRKFGVADRHELAGLAATVAESPGAAAGAVAGMPVPRTRFVGREAELTELIAVLDEPGLVSLIGPGGVGKTRLAARAAERIAAGYAFGAAIIDLVPARDGFIAEAVASVLGVAERPGQPLVESLRQCISRGRRLLVFDNCEHLIEPAGAFIEDLVAACPGLTVLATSRERLAVPGERVVRLPPLSLAATTGPMGAGTGGDAVQLFVERARDADPGFDADQPLIGELCRRLDGIPLAIELAAARSASLGVDGLLAGLSDHLRLLAGGRGRAERHRSLRAVIDWSHDMLTQTERAFFRRVGVFAGAFDLAAAAAVTAMPEADVADATGRLVDKNLLIRRDGPGASRWTLLETIRAYAHDMLSQADEEPATRQRHLGWAAAAAAQAEAAMERDEPWHGRFGDTMDDLRAAVTAAEPGAGPAGAARGLARSLAHLCYARGFFAEARAHYTTAARHARDPAEAARDLSMAAAVAQTENRGDAAFALLLQAAESADAAGEHALAVQARAYAACTSRRFAGNFAEPVPDARVRDMIAQAASSAADGDLIAATHLASARAWIDQDAVDADAAAEALALARRADDPVLISGALDAVVSAVGFTGRFNEAHRLNSERISLMRRMAAHDPRAGIEIHDIQHMATDVAVGAGALPDARAAALRMNAEGIGLDVPHITEEWRVAPLILTGRFDEGLDCADTMWQAWTRAGKPAASWLLPASYLPVLACGLRNDLPAAEEWRRRYSQLRQQSRPVSRYEAETLTFVDGRVAIHAGHADRAAEATANVLHGRPAWYGRPHSIYAPYVWAVAAEAAVIAQMPDAEERLAHAQPAGEENDWAAACLARARGRLHRDLGALRESVAIWDRNGARFERACTLILMPGRAGEARAEFQALGCPPPA